MFLHIGNGKCLKTRCVIGIFDLDTATVTPSTKQLIQHMSKQGEVLYTDDDLPRSFVLYRENKKTSIRLSRISTAGLHGRTRRPIWDTDSPLN